MGIDSSNLITFIALGYYEMMKALRVLLQIGYISPDLVEKAVQISIWVKGLEIRGRFSGPDKFDRGSTFAFNRKGNAAFC